MIMSRRIRFLAGPLAGGMLVVAGLSAAATATSADATAPVAAPIPVPATAPYDGHEWGYTGPTGPSHWGDLGYPTCQEGTEQSPIDISRTRSRGLANPVFSYAKVRMLVEDTGHTIQVTPSPDSPVSSMTVGGKVYSLLQFHFHTPAEHQVDGLHYPAEVHFVHQSEDGAIAVVGVLIAGGGRVNEAWSPFIDAIASSDASKAAEVDLPRMLPKDRRSYRYSGSLTTPPCTEGVAWTVLTTPVTISRPQLNQLLEAYSGNNRPVQPLGDRTVLFDRSSRR